MRINKSVFRYIEFELYNYQETKRELERYKEEILESTNIPEVNVQTMPGNVTESKAIKITSSPFVMRAEKTIKAIDKALAILGEQHWRIFKLKYCDCMPWQEVCLEMDISDRTYFRWRRELVMTVGQQLGLINMG